MNELIKSFDNMDLYNNPDLTYFKTPVEHTLTLKYYDQLDLDNASDYMKYIPEDCSSLYVQSETDLKYFFINYFDTSPKDKIKYYVRSGVFLLDQSYNSNIHIIFGMPIYKHVIIEKITDFEYKFFLYE